MAGCLWVRRWLFGTIWALSAAYTLFDKFYPQALPQPLVDSFAIIMFLLAIFALVNAIIARRRHP
jgi:hypothetical protein